MGRKGRLCPGRYTGGWSDNAEENLGHMVTGNAAHAEINSLRRGGPDSTQDRNSSECHDKLANGSSCPCRSLLVKLYRVLARRLVDQCSVPPRPTTPMIHRPHDSVQRTAIIHV